MIKTARMLFLFMIPIITLAVWNGNASSIEIKLPLFQLTVSLMGLFLILNLFKEKKILISYSPSALLVYVFLLTVISAYFSTSRMSINYRSAMPQIYSILLLIIFPLLFNKTDIKRLLEVIAFVSIPASVYGIMQFFGKDPVDWVVVSERLRVVSFFGHKNYFALYLLIVIPFNFYLSVIEKSREKRILFYASTMLSSLALFLSFSRGALVSFVVFSSISFLLYLNREKLDRIKVNPYYYLLPLFFIVLLLFIIPSNIKKDFVDLYRKNELATRVTFWKGAVEVSSRNPFAGVGPGNFRNEYPLNRINKIHSANPNSVVDRVHNDFLEIYTEYGLWAIFLYLFVMVSFLVRFWKGYHNTKNRDDYIFILCLLSAVASYLAYSTVTVAARFTSSLFYFWMILAMGEVFLSENMKVIYLERKKIKITVVLLVLIVILYSFINSLNRYGASVLVQKSNNHMKIKSGNALEAVKYLETAKKRDPKSIEALYSLGYSSFMISDIKKAEQYYLSVYELSPAYVNIAFNLASCYYRNNDWIKALYYAEQSYKQYPGYTPNTVMLGYCYYYLRLPQKAAVYSELVLRRDPANQSALKLNEKLLEIQEGGSL